MIKAIIFDCFGVLANDGWLPFKRKYFGKNPELFDVATDLNKAVDAGLATYDDFVTEVAELAKIPRNSALEQIEQNPANTELFTYIGTQLKPHYKLGILSNAGANWLSDMFEPAQINLFDEIALSFESGIIKPDPRAYLAIAERLGVEPEACVFIDDQERYCTGAVETGMQAITYVSNQQLQTDLEKILAK